MASNILRRVGWALIVVGLADIGFMAYCIMNDISYSSSLNIFALIAGVFLLRQSMKTAQIVSFFAAFMLSGLSLAAILFPLLMPFDLLVTTVRLNPLGSIGTLLFALTFLAFALWVYRSLTSPVVMEARRLAGVGYKKPTVAFVVGIALAVGLSVIMALVNKGPSAEKAIAKAKETTGLNYSYHVTSMQWAGDSGSAVVTAYNATEIKEVRVEW
jgi:hypothetical protein